MMQRANWDTIREFSRKVVTQARDFDGDISNTWVESNGFVIAFPDGSMVKYTPTITHDADREVRA